MKLIITEKPSVAQELAKVVGCTIKKDGYIEGDNYIITWCYGHLIELSPPSDYDEKYKLWNIDTLPILPENWLLNTKKESYKQFKVLKSLLLDNRYESVIEATDAGREGELIFRHVYNYVNSKLPIERLWINSLEDEDIKKGFMNLKRGIDYEALYHSAYAREKADWLVGMNMTRLFSVLYKDTLSYNEHLSIGRVQTPTLNMIVQRENEINNFTKTLYNKIHLVDQDGNTFDCDKEFNNKEDATNFINTINKNDLNNIDDFIVEEKSKNPPQLFDLTSLQRVCNRRFGFSADKTLKMTQSLYEKKLVTYPRTDSKYINESMVESFNSLINDLLLTDTYKQYDFIPNGKRVANDKKVSDHHAIIPTKNSSSLNLNLSADELNVLNTIIKRSISAVAPVYKYLQGTAIINCSTLDNENIEFKAKTIKVVDKGYKNIETVEETKEEDTKNYQLFKYEQSKAINSSEFTITDHETKPKSRFTEDTLLGAMENAGKSDFNKIEDLERGGLGTTATRAEIIESLIRNAYVTRDSKKHLIPTNKGINLITIVPKELSDVGLTVNWENTMSNIRNGKYAEYNFINEVKNYIKSIVSSTTKNVDINFGATKKDLGKCPKCGGYLVEKKGKFGLFIACSNYPDCNYIKKDKKQESKQLDEVCPKCGNNLVERKGKYGPFVACSNYPDCNYIKKDKKQELKQLDEVCPNCGNKLVERTGKYGKFKACSNYPSCKYIKK